MENGLETQRHGIARELVSAAVAEMVKLAVGLAFMLPVIFVLSRIFSYGRPEEEISFLTFLRRLPSDAQGFPILDRLWPAIGVSASLVAGALLVSVPISGLLGWLAAVRPKWAPVRIAATVISCVPVFAFGRLFLARRQ